MKKRVGVLFLFALYCSLAGHFLLLGLLPPVKSSPATHSSIELERATATASQRDPDELRPLTLEEVEPPGLEGLQEDSFDSDVPPADHNETADEEDFAQGKGRDTRSDSAWMGKFNSEAIGMGGGSPRGRHVLANGNYRPSESRYLLSGTGQAKAMRPATRPLESWKRSTLAPHSSRLSVGENSTLPLQGMQVQVKIDGFRARVLIDYYFQNNHDQQLEGTFQLRLPNEASPYFLAFGQTTFRRLDGQFMAAAQSADLRPTQLMALRAATWRSPKVARIVPRQKAAQAYRQTVRRRVDPALLEWSGAGVFRARVFPLAPRKLHRIVIGYDLNLKRLGGDLLYELTLPEGLAQSSVGLDVGILPGVSVTASPQQRPAAAAGRLFYHWAKASGRTISLRLGGVGRTLLSGNGYLAARFVPELPTAPRAAAERAVFLLDLSYSSRPAQLNIWLELVEALLARNAGRIKQFAVLFFNVESFWWREAFVANTPANRLALIKRSRSLTLEGATDLGAALRAATRPAWHTGQASCDLFLLGDGAVTWGDRQASLLAAAMSGGSLSGPLFAYRSGVAGADLRLLSRLTAASGGALFSVMGRAEIAQAAVAHRALPWQLEGVSFPGAQDLILAGRPRVIYPGQSLLLVGRGRPPAKARLTLRLKQGRVRRVVHVRLDHRIRSALTQRTYGEVAVAQLEATPNLERRLTIAYARHFRVARRTCSMLMLESEQQYSNFEINPKQDALTVAGSRVRALTRARSSGSARGGAKQEFLRWLASLRTAPGARVRLEAALSAALPKLPASCFEVTAERLRCIQRSGRRTSSYDKTRAEVKRRLAAHGPHDALRALSSLVEQAPGDSVLARDVGWSALEWNLPGQAYQLFRRAARQRSYEPTSYWLMARCLARLGRPELAIVCYEIVGAGQWGGRFREVKRIVALDYLRFLKRTPGAHHLAAFAEARRARLPVVQHLDLLVTLAWSTDGTDVDLHVTEPSGLTCSFLYRKTPSGGCITRDVRQGFGPEMYTLAFATPGSYRIRVKYFNTDRNRKSTRTRAYLTIYRNWGTAREQVIRKSITLRSLKEFQLLALIKVPSDRR